MKKKRTFYNAFVVFEDGKGMALRDSKTLSPRFKTYDDAMLEINKAKRNYAKKDMKRTYADGRVEWLSYNDRYDLKYTIEKHYDEYEVLYEEDCPKTKSNLVDGQDSIEISI